MGAEDVIIHSSNIGIVQLAQKLSGVDLYDGYKKFGLTKKSGIDLPYERRGEIPALRQLHQDIYKATSSYGYGMRANLIQLLKGYNAFNNSGRIVTPYIVEGFIDQFGTLHQYEIDAPQQIISPTTAQRMKKILIRTVNKGTGIGTRIEGLEIGGKTGTAKIAHKGGYVKKYNSSFIGFVNDMTQKYTIGVTVIQPRTHYYASLTAVPIFKSTVNTLVDEGYLIPNYARFTLPPLQKKY